MTIENRGTAESGNLSRQGVATAAAQGENEAVCFTHYPIVPIITAEP